MCDVGAAFGHFLKYAQDNGLRAFGSDISAKAVELGRQRLGVEIQVGALTDLTLPSESVDPIVSLDTFYYVADPRAELASMRRLLKPNGVLVLRLRNCASSDEIPHQHLWGFTPRSITNLLERSGWKVDRCEPAAYSASVLAPLASLVVPLNRFLNRVGLPILTHSFNAVARRKA